MARHNAVVLGLVALALPTALSAQTRPSISKEEIIKAMAEEDEIPLPSGTTEKAFNVLGRAPATAARATPAPAYRPTRPTQRAVATTTPGTSVGKRSVRPAGYSAPVLDMRVTFENGSAVLTEQAKAEARVFAEALQSPAMAGKKFTVGGHTDAIGSRAYNLDLSRRRAQAVVDFLVAQGADRSRLIPSGFGFDQPRNGLTARDPGNRRVEFARAS